MFLGASREMKMTWPWAQWPTFPRQEPVNPNTTVGFGDHRGSAQEVQGIPRKMRPKIYCNIVAL